MSHMSMVGIVYQNNHDPIKGEGDTVLEAEA